MARLKSRVMRAFQELRRGGSQTRPGRASSRCQHWSRVDRGRFETRPYEMNCPRLLDDSEFSANHFKRRERLVDVGGTVGGGGLGAKARFAAGDDGETHGADIDA